MLDIYQMFLFYKFYFQRVSPITMRFNPNIIMDHDLLSSNGIHYIIFRNEPVGILDIAFYRFGTAVAGHYIMNITIQFFVPCVNIAFAVVELYKIADDINPNDPEPPDLDPVNNTQRGIVASIPPEFMIGTMIFFGCVVGTPILILVVRKRKNPI